VPPVVTAAYASVLADLVDPSARIGASAFEELVDAALARRARELGEAYRPNA
jgi:hypothetical protein